ncbi:MAG: cation-translocating P-type ATPase [Acidobacteria bacterium]|nr:cation-translocating P-type ATPase [Acidobacteriota bacterium]
MDWSRGLSGSDAGRRRAEFGANQLTTEPGVSAARLLAGQFLNAMVIVLIFAGIVTALTGELADTLVIGAIVLLNGTVGFVQEYRAQRALEVLRSFEGDRVTVRRDGAVLSIPSGDVVPGDVVELAAGDLVAADVRLCESKNLRLAEAALTGESEPVFKAADTVVAPSTPVAERHNMVFKGTAVALGRGTGIVVATGPHTELGGIAELLVARSEVPTPLQRRLTVLARVMAVGATAICALVFVVGVLRGESPRDMFITSVSLAVAAIPEGLPAIITVSLALGARRMAERHALIRKLVAVETLGSVQVICTDKTGTLTENRMQVVRVWTPLGEYRVTGSGYSPEGEVLAVADVASPHDLQDHHEDPFLDRLATVSALCNDATLHAPTGDHPNWSVTGDPTEGALIALTSKLGSDADRLRQSQPRVEELPFDADRRLMTTVHREGLGFAVETKGAVEAVGAVLATRDAVFDAALGVAEGWASEGLRVLAMAEHRVKEAPERLEVDLQLIGLVAITDPPRAEVTSALRECRDAGVRTVVITGDHPSTAVSVARWIGLEVTPDQVVTGEELAQLDDDALDRRVDQVMVYARVQPKDKLRIVASWQRRGAVVAMTGDGVNDAPALRQADIGIAMGVSGTDVSKEAADMVLEDDNFATIVAAIEEGRRIYDNIRRVSRYLLSTNIGELWVMLLAPVIGLPIPLLAVQILWMNLVTDGLPAIALGVEPLEPSAMGRAPRDRRESLFGDGLWQHVLWVGVFMAASVLTLEAVARSQGWPWQTMVFSTLALLQLAHALAVRSESRSLFRMPVRSNRWLYLSVAVTFVVQVLVIYLRPLQRLFHTSSLSVGQLTVVILVSSSILFAVELEKLIRRRSAIRPVRAAPTWLAPPSSGG